MKKSYMVCLATVLVVVGSAGIDVSASTLNVDFGTLSSSVYSGVGAANDTGTKWNALSFTGGSGLWYSDGSTLADGISISTTANGAFSNYNPSANAALIGDRIFRQMGYDPFTVTISGLNNSSLYDLYLYGSYPTYGSKFSVGTVSDYAYGKYSDTPLFTLHENYGLLQTLSPVDGKIEIGVSRYLTSAAAVIGGLQLQENIPANPVPEPATMLLFGTGLSALAGIRLRRKSTLA